MFDRFLKPKRRKYKHSSWWKPKFEQLPDSIKEDYEGGLSILELSLKHDCADTTIRQKLRQLGAHVTKPRVKGYRKGPTKITMEQVDWLLAQDLLDVQHQDLATQLGITRERVRQICLANNHATRRSRQTRAQEIRDGIQARKIAKQNKIQELSRRWNEGASLEEMSILYGSDTPKAQRGATNVANLRKQYPDLFPYRNRKQAATIKLSDSERQAQIKRMSDLWLAGDKTLAEIAIELGFKNAHSLHATIQKYRIPYPELFPPRRSGRKPEKITSAHRQLVSDLWKAGKNTIEIARAAGYTNPKSVHNFINSQRPMFPELFPCR